MPIRYPSRLLVRRLSVAGAAQRRLLLGGLGALAAGRLLAGCGGGGGSGSSGAETPEDIAPNLLQTSAQNQAATFRHADQLGPSRSFASTGRVRTLAPAPRTLEALTYVTVSGGGGTVSSYMLGQRTAGLLVLKNGRVVLERYAMGNTPASRWTSFSVAKSLTATLFGLALREGRIGSLDDSVDDYVTELRGSAYAGTPIRSLLRMTSGIRFSESYALSGTADLTRFGQAALSGVPGAALEYMRTRPRAAPVDSVFNYSTGESYLLGHVLRAATGANLSEYLARTIWSAAGMEAGGYWLTDPSSGLEFAGGNFSATLRDYGRLGLFVLEGGAGSAALPDGWNDLAGRSDLALTAPGRLYAGYPLGYGYQWWTFPGGAGANAAHAGAFVAQGIFGQFLYVNPAQRMVVVAWNAWRDSGNSALEADTYALIAAAVEALA